MGHNQRSSPWEAVVSGTVAGILANTAVYPLDIIKTKLQIQVTEEEISNPPADTALYDNIIGAISQILHEEGISGLYRGLGSSIISTASMNFAYFYWSMKTRILYQTVLQNHNLWDSNSILKELGLGALGGAIAQLCTNPVTVIVTRQGTCRTPAEAKSMWCIVREILPSEHGWTGLWKGLKVNLILFVNSMITYGFYQWLRATLLRFGRQIGFVDTFFLGALSKALATIATHPLIAAKAMLQSQPPECRRGQPFRGFTEVLLYIKRHEGFWRLYKGLAPQLLKGLLVQVLVMMLKERTELFLISISSLRGRRLQHILAARQRLFRG